jgi:glucan phosphoethanolaminetransferase (alkaline phosphatase superfamily)
MRADRIRRLAVGAACAFPLLYAALFTYRYGYSPLVVALHAGEVALVCVVLFVVVRALAAAIGDTHAAATRLIIALTGATITSLYLLVLVVSTVTNEAWGWSVSIDLARTYLQYLPSIVGNLPVSTGLIALGFGLLVAALVGIYWIWWDAAPRMIAALRRSPPRLVTSSVLAVLLGAFILVARRSPAAAAEPFTALFTAPGEANAEQARANNMRARHDYPGTNNFSHRNVIFIFSDALRADHMGVYGYARPTTPFLSHLDSTGHLNKVRLAMATCPFSACGMLSTLASRDSAVLELGSLKLYDILHDRGYRVNFIGSSDHTVWYMLRVHYGDAVDYFFDGFHSKRYSLKDDRLVLEGLEGVGPSHGTPAFFFFFLSATHPVGTKLPEFRRWVPAEVSVGSDATVAQRNAYDNGILQADNAMRQILAALDRKGYLAGSIVVILGDHGDGFGEHGFFGHTRYLYQEMLHIPLLIYDDSAASYANLDFATQSDIAPTIFERLGLPAPSSWQGQSLVSKPAKQFSTHWTDRGRPWHAVLYRDRGRIYKYMYVVRWGRRAEELYELTADPGERRNVIAAAGLDSARAMVRARAAARWPADFRP